MPTRPLLVTAADDLRDALLGCALAAGVEPVVAADPTQAAGPWREAPVVVVDARRAVACVEAGLPRRDRVAVVVPPGHDDPEVWPVALRLGAEEVACLPEAEGWLVGWLGDHGAPTRWARLVAVAGTGGGAGASTLAAALAVTAASQRLDVVLVDADPWGGGIDLLVGGEGIPGIRWPDLAAATGRVSRSSVVPALPVVAGVPVLAWSREAGEVPADSFGSVLDGVCRGGDLVVVDVGRGSPFADTVLGRADAVLVVAAPRLRAVASAARLVTSLGGGPDVRLLVGTGRGVGLHALDVADSLGLPLAGTIPREARRAEAEELGLPPGGNRRGGLARLCRSLLADLPAGRAA